MNFRYFLKKRLNLVLFITLLFVITGILLSLFIPNFLHQMSLNELEKEITEIAENHDTITKVTGTNNLYVYKNGESSMLTANGYINDIDQDIEVHLIHWSEIQQVQTKIYYDDFQNEGFVYYIKVVDDDYYVVSFQDTYSIENFVNTLRIYSFVFIVVLYVGTLLFSTTIFNSSLIKQYSMFDPVTNLNTEHALYSKFDNKDLSKYHISYHNIYNFNDIVDACGIRYHDSILKMVAMNIRTHFNINIIYQITPVEYLIISKDSNDYKKFNEVLNRKMNDNLVEPYSFHTKTVLINTELLKNIDIKTLINRLTYAYAKIKNSTTLVTEVNNNILAEMELEIYYQSNLETAIKKKLLTNFYQAKVDPKTKKIVAAEALSRWMDKTNLVSPSKYIGIAETSGLIYDLDILSFEQACYFVKNLLDNKLVDKSFKISTNFSPITLKNLSIKTVLDITNQAGISPKNMSIEITESVVLEIDIIETILKEFSNEGFTIEIDDFSAGNSSFSVLPILNASYVKIDMAVLPKETKPSKETLIYESLVDISNKLNLKIISEGVEDKSQVDYLTNLEVYAIQGYYFSKPIPENEFIELLKKGV